MLPGSQERILARLADDDVVLDVGGWAKPFWRADWVLDIQPYETRGLYGEAQNPAKERFGAATWVVADICGPAPWPFHDGQFDFAICSHTLEDIRDPVFVCSELQRVAKAGYIEVPSRLMEQSLGVTGPWAGWRHHRWLTDVRADPPAIQFVLKTHGLDTRPGEVFPPGFSRTLTAEEQVLTLWWEGAFEAGERIFLDPNELAWYHRKLVAEDRTGRIPPRDWAAAHARIARYRWNSRRRIGFHKRWLRRG